METKFKDRDNKEFSQDNNIDLSPFNDLLNLLLFSSLPEKNFCLDEPIQSDYFKEDVLKAENNLSKAVCLLGSIDIALSLPQEIVIHAVLLCGEHSKNDIWTSSLTRTYADQLIEEVLIRCRCSSLPSLILYSKVDTFLSKLRPKLLKSSWKNYPAAVSSFMWILQNIKCPHLGDHINSILPTCLLLVDDHLYSNKVMGLQCLQHLANNVSRTDLKQYGRGTVIYNAVEHMIYIRDPNVILPLANCLIALLSKTEHKSSSNTLSWSHFDDVLNIWLPSMEMEQKLVLREAYIDSVNGLLQAMGLSCVRWSIKLIGIFNEYCQQDHTLDKTLMTMLSFINSAWPRVPSNFHLIVPILMKVLINITKKMSTLDNPPESTLNLVKQCFKSLENLSKSEYNDFLNELQSDSYMNRYYLILKSNQSDSNSV